MRWDVRDYYARLRRRLKALRSIKVWQLLVLLLLGGIVAATGLRINNLGMIDRVEAVTKADEGGDPATIQSSITELRRYVASHMNASLSGGIFLTHSYNRDFEAAAAAVQDQAGSGSEVYRQASIECQSRWQGGVESFRNDYVACVDEKVNAAGGSGDVMSQMNLPNSELYKINIISPLWSPDLAGFSVLFCIIIILVILMRLTGVLVIKLLLKRHFSKV